MAIAAMLLTAAPHAAAQQSYFTPSAAMPSSGVWLMRQTIKFIDYGDDPTGLDREIEELRYDFLLSYGLTKELAVMADIPVIFRDVDSPRPGVGDDETGFGDAHVMLDWRIWKLDTGPIDTMRLSLMGGLDVPIGDDSLNNGGWDPMIGAAFMSIQDRHGINAAVRFKFNTHDNGEPAVDVDDGLEDTLFLDAAYLYRLAPADFQAESHGAWYAMVDVNSTYETNGDTELRLAPGIMYEARRWVFEATVQLPVYEELDHRPQLDVLVGLGLRILF
jgi:hypothetical protein